MTSLSRILAIMGKEFIQMLRDRLTFGMMVGIPVMQLLLFGYAINTDPRNLPTLVEMGDNGPASRAITQAMETSEYFDLIGLTTSAEETESALQSGDVLFVVTIPPNFERDLLRGDRPQILLDADASDPVAAGAGAGAFPTLVQEALAPLLGEMSPPVQTVIHRRYNPAGRTALNIVPGLLGVILTMTMAMMTSMALTREAERGTLETLLATPTRPHEVMIGKITPYVFVGSIQVAILLAGAQPDAGHADDLLHLPALHPPVRLHVPLCRHAGLGPDTGPGPAHHAFHPRGALDHAERGRLPGRDPRHLAPGRHLRRDRDAGHAEIPADAGLMPG